jgi:heat shock protein HtpX
MEKISMFNEIRKNKIKSFFLIIIFILIIGLLGTLIGQIYGNPYIGVTIAIIASLLYTIISFFSGDSMILSMSNAKPVSKQEYPHLYHTIEGIAIAAGIKTPKAYVIQDDSPNAFATGRDPEHASVAVTTGLLNKLNRQELEGVVAHEISHIKNYDIRIMMIATVMIGIITLLSDFLLRTFLWGSLSEDREKNQATFIFIALGLVMAILTPLVGQIIKLAISRKREYAADATGASLTRYPDGLANALEKIKNSNTSMKNENKATAHLYISNPLKNKKRFLSNLFATHPDIDDRIKKLRSM